MRAEMTRPTDDAHDDDSSSPDHEPVPYDGALIGAEETGGDVLNETERRLAVNEEVFRRVNEGIERSRWPGEDDGPVGFRCECARLGCNRLVSLTTADYERVRSHPRRFFMLTGHQMPDVERVVEDLGDVIIVEKIGEAAEEVEARSPRG
jgi:hypothetical protein